jgi:hypothetical protein
MKILRENNNKVRKTVAEVLGNTGHGSTEGTKLKRGHGGLGFPGRHSRQNTPSLPPFPPFPPWNRTL